MSIQTAFFLYTAPSPPSNHFKMKGKFGVPGPPGQPQVIKVGRGYADLVWEAPKTDGGSRQVELGTAQSFYILILFQFAVFLIF